MQVIVLPFPFFILNNIINVQKVCVIKSLLVNLHLKKSNSVK